MDCDPVASPLCHPFNDADLLRILFAEERLFGAYEVKETRDNGCHAGEVPGAGGAFKSRGEWTRVNCWDGIIGWIDLVSVGYEE
jgi:hypothetical protein